MTGTKDALLNAAEAGVRKNGYNAVSFRELADALGIKSASVHYHFRRKEDLGTALVARYSEGFFSALAKFTEQARSPREKIAGYCATYRAALHASDAMCLCGVLGAEISSLPDAVARSVDTFFKNNLDWLTESLPASMDDEKRRSQAALILSALQGGMMLSHATKDMDILDRTAAEIVAGIDG